MSKEKKLFDWAKRARKIGYKVNEFFKYRLLVNAKHVLIIGGEGTHLKRQIIQNFGDTWRIACIDQKQNANSELNIDIDFNQNLELEKIQEISENLKKFSKHYESIIVIPDTTQKIGDISDPAIFEQMYHQQQNIMQPSLLATFLASKYLTSNGIIMFKGDQRSFEAGQPNYSSYSMTMNQLNNLNVILGEREDIDVDSVPIVLLDRDSSSDIQNEQKRLLEKQKPKKSIVEKTLALFRGEKKEEDTVVADSNTEQKEQQEQNSSQIQQNIQQDKQLQQQNQDPLDYQENEEESYQIADMIRLWSEGKDRPMPGAFVKFEKIDGKLYPKLL